MTTPAYRYEAAAQWRAGRDGFVVRGDSLENSERLEFSAPAEFGGDASRWSPEQFLMAAIAACFITAFRAIAELSKFSHAGLEISVEGTVGKRDTGFGFTDIRIEPVLTIEDEAERARALRLLEKAKHSCLISRSLNCEVAMEPQVRVGMSAPVA